MHLYLVPLAIIAAASTFVLRLKTVAASKEMVGVPIPRGLQ